jgi:hypothetical protein
MWNHFVRACKTAIEKMGLPVGWGGNPHKFRSYKQANIAAEFERLEQTRKAKRESMLAERETLRQRLLQEPEQPRLPGKEQGQAPVLRAQITDLDAALAELESSHMLLEGTTKTMVLAKVEYFKFQFHLLRGMALSPEKLKVLENVHYLATNNLPVPRYRIYTIAPELFTAEIGELEAVHRQLLEEGQIRLEFKGTGLGSFNPKGQRARLVDNPKLLEIDDDMDRMELLVHQKLMELIRKYETLLDELAGRGFRGDFAFDHLEFKPQRS